MSIPRENYTPSVLVDTADLSEEDWLEWRRKGIGGSDAAAILGISPFGTARDLYYDKLKILPIEVNDDNWVQKEIGHLLEDLVAQIFNKKTGYKVYQVKKMFRHPKYSFMLADVDYFVELPDGTTAILEIKTTNYNAREHWWRDGKEIVPINYETQGRHYMCVMNVDRVFYCCLYGNNYNEVIIREIKRDYDYEEELIALEDYFWNNNVLAQKEPPYTEDGDLILASVNNHCYPTDTANTMLDISSASCILRFKELKEQKSIVDAASKRYKAEMDRMQGIIVDKMKGKSTAECVINGEKYAVSYKPSYTPTVNKKLLIRLKAQHPEVYNEYVSDSVTRRFYVKKVAQEAA